MGALTAAELQVEINSVKRLLVRQLVTEIQHRFVQIGQTKNAGETVGWFYMETPYSEITIKGAMAMIAETIPNAQVRDIKRIWFAMYVSPGNEFRFWVKLD